MKAGKYIAKEVSEITGLSMNQISEINKKNNKNRWFYIKRVSWYHKHMRYG